MNVKKMISPDEWNAIFKQGRKAGQEDVALEILKHRESDAYKIAREFLERSDD